MLKFEKLERILNEIVKRKKEDSLKNKDVIEFLVQYLMKISPDDFVSNVRMNFPYAIPIEPPVKVFKENTIKGSYRIIACDGSDTPLRDDFIFPYFLINIGFAYFQYFKNPKFVGDSEPEIFYTPDYIYAESMGIRYPISTEGINLLMLLKESTTLANKIKEFDLSNPSAALIDGSVIQWGVREKSVEKQKEFFKNYGNLLIEARKLNIPVAGYISGSRSRDVLGSINYYLMMKNISFLEEELFFIYDTDIFQRILKPFERSVLFQNNEQFIKFYPEKIFFYYINNGYEVVRIEIPEFVAKNEDLFNTLNSILLNQSEKGGGYPEVLKEAHEQAVIHKKEQDAIEEILLNLLRKEGYDFKSIQKVLAKKIRTI